MKETYNARKPDFQERPIKKCLKFVPPFAFWYMAKAAMNYFFGRLVGNIVSDGQVVFRNDRKNYDDANNRFNKSINQMIQEFDNKVNQNKDVFAFNKFAVNTYDHQKLSGLEILHKSKPEEKKYLVMFQGRGVLLENTFDTMYGFAKDFDCNVISYNYRGVYNSTGKATSYKQMVSDGIAQVERLLDKGIKPQNIILYGHSLGASVATLTAEYFHKQNKKVYLFDDRAFVSVPKITSGIVNLNFQQKGIPGMGRLAQAILHPPLKAFINMSGWEMNIGPAFKNIPAEYRDYTVVRSTKEIRAKQLMLDDGVIDYKSTLHHSLKPERKIERHQCKFNIQYAKEHAGKDIAREDAQKIISANVEKLRAIDAHKFKGISNEKKETLADILKSNRVHTIPHTLKINKLQNRVYNESGKEYLGDFIKKIQGMDIKKNLNSEYLTKEMNR